MNLNIDDDFESMVIHGAYDDSLDFLLNNESEKISKIIGGLLSDSNDEDFSGDEEDDIDDQSDHDGEIDLLTMFLKDGGADSFDKDHHLDDSLSSTADDSYDIMTSVLNDYENVSGSNENILLSSDDEMPTIKDYLKEIDEENKYVLGL